MANSTPEVHDDDTVCDDEDTAPFSNSSFNSNPASFNQATSYVAGYLLKRTDIPDCDRCRETLYSAMLTEKHVYVQFKEHDSEERLCYASEQLIQWIESIHVDLYNFLDKNAHRVSLEDTFKQHVLNNYDASIFCHHHNIVEMIWSKCIRLVIHKYIKKIIAQQ